MPRPFGSPSLYRFVSRTSAWAVPGGANATCAGPNDANFAPRATANTNRCGFEDAWRSLDSTSGEIAVFLAPRSAPAGPVVVAAVATVSATPAVPARNPRREISREKSSGGMLLSCRVVVATGHRVSFQCNGDAVELACEPGESLLNVLRERLGITSVKDGCAPQGQCGCCTVLV